MNDPVDFNTAGFALSRHVLQCRDNRGQQLHDDGRGDIRENTQRHDTHPPQGATRKQVQEPQQLVIAEQVFQRRIIQPRNRYMSNQPVQGQHTQSKQYLGTKIWQAERVKRSLN